MWKSGKELTNVIMIEKINSLIERKKSLPIPEVNMEYYNDNKICPICLESVNEDDLIHPNDTNKKMLIHELCWKFIRNHERCRGCRKYISKEDKIYRLPEFGVRCIKCTKKILKK